MADFWDEELFSMRMAPQAAFDARDALPTWTNLQATLPSIDLAREVEDLNLSVSDDFISSQKAVGRKSGTVSFTIPLRSQLATYDPSSGAPGENPEITLLKDIIGTSIVGTYDAGEFDAGATAATWPMVTPAVPPVGTCVLAEDPGDNTVRAAAWVRDLVGNNLEAFEDTNALPVLGDNLVQTLVLYSDGSTPAARTFRVVGTSADHCIDLIGCKPESCNILFEAGQVPRIELSYKFTDYEWVEGAGGLVSATDYSRLGAAMGVNGGRVLWDGFALSADAAADPVGTCGLSSLAIAIEIPVRELMCHSAAQGMSDMVVAQRNATVTFSIPHTTDFTAVGVVENDFELSLVNNVRKSLSLQVGIGKAPGQFFALLIPACVVSEQPAYAAVDGLQSWTITAQPEKYTGDAATGSSAVRNKPFRMAFG